MADTVQCSLQPFMRHAAPHGVPLNSSPCQEARVQASCLYSGLSAEAGGARAQALRRPLAYESNSSLYQEAEASLEPRDVSCIPMHANKSKSFCPSGYYYSWTTAVRTARTGSREVDNFGPMRHEASLGRHTSSRRTGIDPSPHAPSGTSPGMCINGYCPLDSCSCLIDHVAISDDKKISPTGLKYNWTTATCITRARSGAINGFGSHAP